MKEFIEKLIGRLEEESRNAQENMVKSVSNSVANFCSGASGAYNKTIAIVNQLAEEYNNCSTDISTNADRIRAMSDEELAEYIFGVSIGNAPCVLCSDECDFCELSDEECKEKTLNWLQSEAE